jgi:Membrane protein involved in the export of O-antigen and teichoic acid
VPEPLKSRVGLGATALLFGNFASLVIQGIGAILVARFLGSTLYGYYTLLLVPSATLYSFSLIGIPSAISRFVPYFNKKGESETAARIASNGFVFGALFYLVVTIIALLLTPFFMADVIHQPTLTFYAQLASVTIFSQGLINFASGFFIGSFSAQFVSLLLVLQAVLKTGVSLALIWMGYGLSGAVFGLVTSYVFTSALALFLILWKTKIVKPKNFWEDVKTLTKFSIPGYVGNIVNGLARQLQLILIALFAGAAAVGAFSAMLNLAALITLLASPVSTMMLPAFSELSLDQKRRVALSYEQSTLVSSILQVPFALFFVVASHQLVEILYDRSYTSFYLTLALLSVGYLNVGLGGSIQPSLLGGLNKPLKASYIGYTGSAVQLIGTFLLTSKLGAEGAAIATSLGSLLSAVFGHILVKQECGANLPKKKLLFVHLDAMLSALIVYFVLPQNVLRGLYGVLEALLFLAVLLAVYLVLLPLTHALQGEELELMTHSLKGIPVVGSFWALLKRPLDKLVSKKNKF